MSSYTFLYISILTKTENVLNIGGKQFPVV